MEESKQGGSLLQAPVELACSLLGTLTEEARRGHFRGQGVMTTGSRYTHRLLVLSLGQKQVAVTVHRWQLFEGQHGCLGCG